MMLESEKCVACDNYHPLHVDVEMLIDAVCDDVLGPQPVRA